jgi:hypothetical protein
MLAGGEHETKAVKRSSKIDKPSTPIQEEDDELLIYEEETKREAIDDVLLLQYTPFRQLAFLARLFFSRKYLLIDLQVFRA